MSWKFQINKKAVKFLSRQNAETRERILRAVFKLPSFGDIKAMQGDKNFFRLRVGSFRVIYRVDGDAVIVETIGNRGDIYGK